MASKSELFAGKSSATRLFSLIISSIEAAVAPPFLAENQMTTQKLLFQAFVFVMEERAFVSFAVIHGSVGISVTTSHCQ
jgi:hypothetical protein